MNTAATMQRPIVFRRVEVVRSIMLMVLPLVCVLEGPPVGRVRLPCNALWGPKLLSRTSLFGLAHPRPQPVALGLGLSDRLADALDLDLGRGPLHLFAIDLVAQLSTIGLQLGEPLEVLGVRGRDFHNGIALLKIGQLDERSVSSSAASSVILA